MKKNIISILIIVILSSVAVFLSKKPVKTTGDFDGKILGADSSKVIEISYEQDGKKIMISRGLNKWQIKEPRIFEPDPSVPKTLLQFVNDITLKNVISEKSEKFSKFGVDSTGIVLTVRKEDNSRISYIIGGDDQERNYSFFRIPDDDRIFLGTLFPRYRISSNVNDWRNKLISNVNISELKEFSLTAGADIVEVSRLNESWKVSFNGADSAVVKEKIEPAAGKIASFIAADFIDGLSLNDIVPSIVIKYSSGNSVTEIILSKTAEGFYAFRKDKNQAYRIQESDYAVFENLLRKKL